MLNLKRNITRAIASVATRGRETILRHLPHAIIILPKKRCRAFEANGVVERWVVDSL